MKKPLIIFLLLFIFFRCIAPVSNGIIISISEQIVYIGNPNDWLQAIMWVESGNDGKGEYSRNEPQAKGILQQYPIFVRDVNRIIGYEKYSLDDRLDNKKAEEMFWIYQHYYNPEMSFEKMCRIQSGGPNGYLQDCTIPYFNLVKKRLFLVL